MFKTHISQLLAKLLGWKGYQNDRKGPISKFPGQPCGFKVAKDKKHRKFGQFLEAYLNVGAPCRDNQTSYFVAPDAFSIKDLNYWVARVPWTTF